MSDNVVDFPGPETQESLFLPRSRAHPVQVEGRKISGLSGLAKPDGSVTLIVDERFGAGFPNEQVARDAAWLIAQALAIGRGYSHLGAERPGYPFAPFVNFVVDTKETDHDA